MDITSQKLNKAILILLLSFSIIFSCKTRKSNENNRDNYNLLSGVWKFDSILIKKDSIFKLNEIELFISFNEKKIFDKENNFITFCIFQEDIGQVSFLIGNYLLLKKYPYPTINNIKSEKAKKYFINEECSKDINTKLKKDILFFLYSFFNNTFKYEIHNNLKIEMSNENYEFHLTRCPAD